MTDHPSYEQLLQRVIELEKRLTTNRLAEEAIRESEERHRIAIECSDGGVALVKGGNQIFVNQKYVEIFGYDGPEEIVGTPLTTVLHPDDRERVLKFNRMLQNETSSPVRYECKGLRKDGRSVHLEVSTVKTTFQGDVVSLVFLRDIGDRKRTERIIHRRDAILEAVDFAAEQFLKTDHWESNIHEVLRRLGQATEVSRVYLFSNHADADGNLLTSQRFEWVANGIKPQIDRQELQSLLWREAGFARWEEVLSRGQAIYGRVKDLPEVEQELLASQAILSLVVHPIFVGRRWWGFLGFDDCLTEREWSKTEIDALKAAANLLGTALQHKQADDALRTSEACLRKHYRMLSDLAKSKVFRGDDLDAALKEITAAAARVFDLERVSMWLYNEDHTKLRCIERYELSKDIHSRGYEVNTSSFPAYFEALDEDRTLAVDDARNDPRTKELWEVYLSPLGISSILDAPIRMGGYLIGVLCHEHVGPSRHWTIEEQHFAGSLADFVSSAIESEERRSAEKALRESEEKYRTVIENANETILVAQEGIIKFVNSKTKELTGYETEEVISRPFTEFIHPDDQKMVMERHVRRLKGEDVTSTYPFRLVHKSGETPWAEINSVLTTWEGKPATLSFLSDISKRKMVENALRESEIQKQAILDASIDRIRHVDKDMKIIWANKTTAAALGAAPEDLVGRACYQLFTGRERPCEGCPTATARKTGRIEKAIIRQPFLRGSEEDSYWEVYSVPIKNEAGDITSFIQISRDITDQIKALTALRESEEKFKSVFSQSPIGVGLFDSQGKLIDANRSTLGIFGIVDLEDIKPFNLFKLFKDSNVPRDAKARLRLGATLRFETSIDFERVKELKLYPTKRSGTIYLDLLITQLGAAGQDTFSGYLVQIQDITGRKRAEENIRSLSQQLMRAQEVERQKLSCDLHDNLAQDLSALKVGLDTLFDARPDGHSEKTERVLELSKLVHRTITAVRDMAYDLSPVAIDQLGLIRTIHQYCEEFSTRHGLKIDFFSAGLDGVRLDFDTEIGLYRLFQEALNNIKKHAAATQVSIRLVASFPDIILRIEDNGKGFDVANRLQKAFNERRMGIRSMEERVALLRGKMRIESRPLQGTKILVEVPYLEKQDAQKKNGIDHR